MLIGPPHSSLRLPHPYHHIAFEDICDLTVELVEPSIQDEEGLSGWCHKVLSKQSTAHHYPVSVAPWPLEWPGGLFQTLDHLDFASTQLHKQNISLAARATKDIVLVKFCEGALKGQIRQVKVGVNVKGHLDLSPLRDDLNPH